MSFSSCVYTGNCVGTPDLIANLVFIVVARFCKKSRISVEYPYIFF